MLGHQKLRLSVVGIKAGQSIECYVAGLVLRGGSSAIITMRGGMFRLDRDDCCSAMLDWQIGSNSTGLLSLGLLGQPEVVNPSY